MPWLSACCVLLGHRPRSGEGPALLVAGSRSEFGRVEGSQVPSPATPLKRKRRPLTTPAVGARPLQRGLEKGRLHSPGAPLGRVDLEPLLSAGDILKGAVCSRPRNKERGQAAPCVQTDRQTQGHGGGEQSSQCVCARPRVGQAPLETAEGSRVEASEPSRQVR